MLAPRKPESLRIQDMKDHREEIAIKAMTALLNNSSVFLLNKDMGPVELSEHCYAIADAMVKQKNKLPNTRPDNE